MRLTTQTDYALRVLMFLVAANRRATSAEVAALYGISANHVAKVVNQLARLGYVRSLRGIGGGIELARRPEEVRLGEVIEAFEGSLRLLDCVETDNGCAIHGFCKLKGALAEAERAQLEALNRVTLRDVSPTPRQFARVKAS
jgi:Rrf2 family nitric oxide-sensitive transcriptional repressor